MNSIFFILCVSYFFSDFAIEGRGGGALSGQSTFRSILSTACAELTKLTCPGIESNYGTRPTA